MFRFMCGCVARSFFQPMLFPGSEVMLRKTLIAIATFAAFSTAAHADFTAGDLVVYRVGDGSAALSGAATQVFLNEFNTGGTLVQSLTVNGLTASGTATSEGLLTLSTNGSFLEATGYSAAVGTAAIASTTAAVAPRTVTSVDSTGTMVSTSLSTVYSGNNIRSAITTDGTNFYTGGPASGILFGTTGSATTTALSTANTRQVDIFNNQLYYSTGSGTTGIYSLGTGLPTGGAQTATLVAASASPYAFVFANLGGSPGFDTLYVADDTATTGGIKKYSLVGTAWTLNNTILGSGIRGLTGTGSGASFQLYATSGTSLFSLTDTAGYNASLNGTLTTLATAPTNEVFRGVAFAPTAAVAAIPEPETYAMLLAGLGLIGFAARRRRK
jgi:hypothetical protein